MVLVCCLVWLWRDFWVLNKGEFDTQIKSIEELFFIKKKKKQEEEENSIVVEQPKAMLSDRNPQKSSTCPTIYVPHIIAPINNNRIILEIINDVRAVTDIYKRRVNPLDL